MGSALVDFIVPLLVDPNPAFHDAIINPKTNPAFHDAIIKPRTFANVDATIRSMKLKIAWLPPLVSCFAVKVILV
jgi:hypothetical protein